MARPNKGNDASRFRDLRRRARKDAPVDEMEDILKHISDPYFRSQAHLLIAQKNNAKDRIERSLAAADRVEALWRRAELFVELLKMSKDLDRANSVDILNAVGEKILLFPNGKGLSDSLASCTSKLLPDTIPGLLGKALNNRGFEQKDSKNVIKAWSRGLPGTMGLLKDIEEIILSIDDPQLKAQLLGYIHLQLERSEVKDIPHRLFEEALDAAFSLKGEQRLEMVSYLSSAASSAWSIELLHEGMKKDTSVMERTKMISYLASAADRGGHDKLAAAYLNEALDITDEVENKKKRSGLRLHLAQNFLRMGRSEEALKLMEKIREETKESDPTRVFMVKALQKAKITVPEDWVVPQTPVISTKPVMKEKRDVLALYDTYEGAIKDIHIRAIARAAPLCYGFDLDLALIGFPETDLDGLVEKTSKETNIGKGGRYLKDLHSQGRIHLMEAGKNELPGDIGTVGLAVATTSRPMKEKTMNMASAVKRSGDGSVCVIMGLGKQGLPKKVLDASPAHLELTGRNIPLETATAMGIIAYQMFVHRN